MGHHFVPQFYLRSFRDPNVPEGQEPIWIADFKEGTVERRAPKNSGKKAGYYAFPEVEAAGGEAVESVFSKLESTAAPVIRRLLVSDDAALEGQDRADLLFFMAFFVIRVPFFRNMLEKFAADMAKMVLQESASHLDYFERTLREALKGKEDLTPEQVEDLRQWVLDESRYTIQPSPKLSIVAGFEAATEAIYPTFDGMRWAVVRAGESFRYITSDTPVSWVDPTISPPFAYGLQARNVEVTFPVSPTVCVFGTWEGPKGAIKARDRSVKEFNTRRVGFSDRFVFAHSEEGARCALDLRQQMEPAPIASKIG